MILVQNHLRQLSGSKQFFLLLFFLFTLLGNAQIKEFSHSIIHKVKSKETIELIAARYGISKDQIVKYNPKFKNGIRKRDKIKIPRFKINLKITEDVKNKSQHTVQSKETLWRIAYNYGISVDSLKVLNPELGDTISVGMLLKVPYKSANDIEGQYYNYIVKPKDGYYRLKQNLGLSKNELELLNPELIYQGLKAGMVLKVPKKTNSKSTIDSLDFQKQITLWDSAFISPVVKIAFMAPFRLNRIELDSIDQTSKTLSERNLTTVSLDFYTGILHAIDSLNKVDISVELTVYDTENQLYIIEQLLNDHDFSKFDVIIGPFTPINLSRMAQAMSFFNVPVISPLTTRDIQPRKMLINSIPSRETLTKRMISYVDTLDNSANNPCILIIADQKSELTALRLKEQFPLAEMLHPDERFGYIKPDVVDSLLTPGRPNWVFLETDDLNLVTSMTSMLNAQQSNKRTVQLFTHSRTSTYDDKNIFQEHLGNLRFTYPSYFLEQRDSIRIKFDFNFQKIYGKSPNRTALKGYDIMIDASLRIATKRKLINSLNIGTVNHLQNKFNYKPDSNGGFRNIASYMIQHKGYQTFEISNSKRQSDSLDVR